MSSTVVRSGGFCIASMPRSRSYWLSTMLGCPHDYLGRARDWDSFIDRAYDVGAVDTGVALWPERLLASGLKVVVVKRSMSEVMQSLRTAFRKANIEYKPRELEHLLLVTDQGLTKLAAEGLCPTMDARMVTSPEGIEFIWNYIRPEQDFPRDRYEAIMSKNLQVPFQEQLATVRPQFLEEVRKVTGLST